MRATRAPYSDRGLAKSRVRPPPGRRPDGVRGRATGAESRVEQSLGLPRSRDDGVDEGRLAERHGDRDEETDGARPPGWRWLAIGVVTRTAAQAGMREADRGGRVRPFVFACAVTHPGRGEEPGAVAAPGPGPRPAQLRAQPGPCAVPVRSLRMSTHSRSPSRRLLSRSKSPGNRAGTPQRNR